MIKFKEELFEQIVRATQTELLNEILIDKMGALGMIDYVHTEDYLMYHGDTPVMLVAHLDTVHKEPVQSISKLNGTWTSPQGIGGDDRCGVYMILDLIEALPFKPYVLFSTEEEVGCLGTKKFLQDFPVNEFDIKFLIEFDRKGRDEVVFYDCDNHDFHAFITENTSYEKKFGSYTDICHIMEKWDTAGVNFSCGYYNAHTLSEYVKIGEMMNTIRVVYTLLEKLDFDSLPHYTAEIKQRYSYYGGSYGNYYWNRGLSNFDWGAYYRELGYDVYGDEGILPSVGQGLANISSTNSDNQDGDSFWLRTSYYGTWGGVNYYKCECGELVDEDTFKNNEYYCSTCYAQYFLGWEEDMGYPTEHDQDPQVDE